jgi:glycosyltransferase involved in cell wall biosynthesis
MPTLPADLASRRVALVHDWLVSTRGGESVLASLCRLFPGAPIFTLFHDPKSMRGPVGAAIAAHPIYPSFLQTIPGARRVYRALLPVLPYAVEAFDLRGFDLVVSSSHCVAKGVIPSPDATHVSYVHTPMRYAYEQLPDYFGPDRLALPVRIAVRAVMHHLRVWDEASANRVDHYIANSHHVARRIQARYRRTASVVHPPVDVERFHVARAGARHGRFLMLGAFAPYKRVDLAIDSFNRMALPLDIVGTGQDERRLRAMAGPTVRFLGPLDDAAVSDAYATARALIFPGEEDFGITPVEAMASGTPVIAYGRGGAAETVVDLRQGSAATGILFGEQSVQGLADAVGRFIRHERDFNPEAARAQALRFSRTHFEARMVEVLAKHLSADLRPSSENGRSPVSP